jgi:hypothetical protein
MQDPPDIRQQFAEVGFEVVEAAAGSLEVRKNNCAQTVTRDSGGTWRALGPPQFMVRGVKCELEDRGYQKFWYHDGKRFPIKQNDLKTLHRFDEEVRAILGLKSLYNESLGSTCARSVYDRLQGRAE